MNCKKIPFQNELHLFHQATRIPLCVFDNSPKELLRYPFIATMDCSSVTMQHCCTTLNNASLPNHTPMLFSSASCFFALLRLDPTTNIMLGPVSSVPVTYREFYAMNHAVCDQNDLLHLYRVIQQSPHLPLSQFANALSLFVQLVFQTAVSTETILSHHVSYQHMHTQKQAEQIATSLEEPHYMSITETMDFQKNMLYHIQKGDIEEINRNFQQTPIFHNLEVSPSSLGDLQKIFFIYATLCCVSVLEAKLELQKAFPIFDSYIAKIPSITSPDELSELCRQISLDYGEQMRVSKTPHSVSPIVTKCLHYIHDNLYSKITIADLAQYCCSSTRTITRHFAEFFHTAAVEYIIDCKLEEAVFLLTQSTLTLAEISHQLAFSSQSHFTVSFKKKYSCTPQKYRNSFSK